MPHDRPQVCSLTVSMLGTAASISLPSFRRVWCCWQDMRRQAGEQLGFLFSQGEVGPPLLDLSRLGFRALPSFHWWKQTLFPFVFPIHILQCTEGKLSRPLFVTLRAVLVQCYAWSYSTKRQLGHGRHVPCLLSRGQGINLLFFSKRHMEMEGLSSSVIQLTNVWLMNMIWNWNETSKRSWNQST